jgi:hypothetical protein
MGFIIDKLAGARLFKPLCGRTVGFDFWHAYISLSYSFMRGVARAAKPPANFSIWRHHRQKSFGVAGFLQAHANSVANAATLI